MHPILFDFGNFRIYTFGVLIAAAYLLGYLWIAFRARKLGENVDHYIESAIWFIVAGIGGARLFYFILFPANFFANPMAAIFSQGGLVWYGGMLGVTLAGILFCLVRKVNFWRFADVVAPAAALGLAIGRVGCLMAGCCYGAPCDVPWAIHYPHDHETHGLAVHPTPLYETTSLLLALPILLAIDKRKPFEGMTASMFFIIYGFIRFTIEYFRGDRVVWIEALNLSASQVMSLVGIAIGLVIIAILNWQAKRPLAKPAA